MPIIRKWSATARTPLGTIGVTFECPYYNELVAHENEVGRLPKRELAAHALWDYYGMALKAYDMAQKNIVYEDELSRVFDEKTARQMFQSVANKHGVKPWEMVRFWDLMDAQRIALGGKDQLPERFKFKFWSN